MYVLYCICLFLTLLVDNASADQTPLSVWLTVSPKANRTSQRLIEIHWRNAVNSGSDDWIGLFTINPTDKFMESAIESVMVNSRESGTYLTQVQFPYRNFSANLTEQCLGYFVAYIHNNSSLAKNCIKTNPFWIEKSLPLIGHRTLPSIMIPGTHNSGSYEKWTKNSYYSLLKRFVITQDESIYNQLVYGVRYLDMRIGYYDVSGSDDKLWIVHDLLRTNLTLHSAVKEVKQFVTAAPKEIVIFDFHRFVKGFELNDENNETVIRKRFEEFSAIITNELGDLAIPYSLGYGITINDLIRLDKRILIGFQTDKSKYLANQYLWPSVRHQWPNTDRLPVLVQYFADTLCNANRKVLRSAMAELTPTRWGVLSFKYTGVRALANITNSHMTEWFADRWSHCANIVAVDFFLSTNIVDIAINANTKQINN